MFGSFGEKSLIMPSKIFVQKPRTSGVTRTPLLARMTDVSASGLALVVAPAGYGKTTLLAQWAEQQCEPIAWLQLESGDNRLRQYGSCLIASLQTSFPDLGKVVQAALKTAGDEQLIQILTGFVHDLHAHDHPLSLIIDDYHLITAEPVHQFMVFLIENRPSWLRLLIGSRTEPAFPVARWRARAQIIEIVAEDLSFSKEETREFLEKTMRLSLSGQQCIELYKRSEGWAAGLQLASLSIKKGTVQTPFGRGRENQGLVFAYLTDEVLSRETGHVRRFLLDISILDAFNAELCAHVTGVSDSKPLLSYLNQANLFLTPLDDEGNWFRFHHLFGAVLRRHMEERTSPDAVRALHAEASDWLNERGIVDEALEHAAAACDEERAVAIVNRHGMATLLAGDPLRTSAWIESLPPETVTADIRLNLTMAWSLIASLRHGPLIERHIRQAREALAHGPDPGLQTELNLMEGVVAGVMGRHEDALRMIGNSLDTIPYAKGIGLMHLGINCFYLDRFCEAAEHLERALVLNHELGNHAIIFYAELLINFGLIASGRLSEAKQRIETLFSEVTENAYRHNPSSSGVAKIGLSVIHWERCEVERACELVGEAMDLGRTGGFIDALLFSRASMAWIRLSEGRFQEAGTHLNQVETVVESAGLHHWISPLSSLRAHVWLRQYQRTGNRAAYQALAEWVEESAIQKTWREKRSQIILPYQPLDLDKQNYVRFLLMEGKTGHAIEVLEQLVDQTRAAGRYGHLVGVLVLLALAYEQHGDRESASNALERAVLRGESEGYTRVFVQEGPAMLQLIERTASSRPQSYYEHLCKIFDESDPVTWETGSARPKEDRDENINELLSPREREVLALIAHGLTNREAADRLFIAPGTVKKHLENIYSRLSVKNRTQAIARARSMGML